MILQSYNEFPKCQSPLCQKMREMMKMRLIYPFSINKSKKMVSIH